MRARLRRWLRDLELEEALVSLTALVLVPAVSWSAAQPWGDLVPLVPLRAGLGLVGLLGVWSAAARPLPAAEGETRAWRGLRHLALLSTLLAFPALAAALSDGDTGFGWVLAGVGLAGLLPALAWSGWRHGRDRAVHRTSDAPSDAPSDLAAVRGLRWRLLPVTVLNTWFATEALVDRYLLDAGDLRQAALALDEGVLAFLGRVLAQLGAAAVLLAVPWLVLVVPPRIAAGERVGPAVWARRYAALVASVALAFGVQAGRSVGAARAEARHHLEGLAAARARPLDVQVLSLRAEDMDGLDLSAFPNLVELVTPPGWDGPLEGLATAPGLVRLVLSPALVTRLPEAICGLRRLEVLDAEGNRLDALPDCLAGLTELRRLHLAGNRLTRLPPPLPRLQVLELHDDPLPVEALESLRTGLDAWPALAALTVPWLGGPLDRELRAVARSRGLRYRSGAEARR